MKKRNAWHTPTLAEALADANLSTVCEDYGHLRVFGSNGEVFRGSEDEVWIFLREEGYVHVSCRDCSHDEVDLDLSGYCEECAETTDRRIDRQRRIDEHEGRGDYLRDQQRGEL